ncbi:MAG: glycosyltransferase family 2 protein [bacterium]|nr:glycosyltransferase family 2 protein [bacterium]
MPAQVPYLSVIIPSYNEEKNFKRGALDEALSYLQKQTYDWEMILSDDGSTDKTLDALNNFAAKDKRISVLANEHGGKGPTVQSGMLAAKGEWRLFTDFDQSTPLSEVERLLAFTPTCEVVIGSREGSGSRRENEPSYRHYMGRAFNLVVQVLALPGILDSQCGFKLFSANAATQLFSNLSVYGRSTIKKGAFTGAFDVELLFLARKLGILIEEVPITWKHYDTDRVDPVKDSLRMLKDIIRVRIAYAQGKYAKLLGE